LLYIETNGTDAAYNFSAEEYLTRYRRFDARVLMLWQADRCVMLGNNQAAEAETDMIFTSKENISIIRRSSGGGAIFTDRGTVLYTYIEALENDAKTHRETAAASIIEALGTMGVNAVQEGRNDILLEGRKISGLAQYVCGGFICTHGSLLYDTDLDMLTAVLVADETKLHPKGIQSIRSRVTNIKPYIKDGSFTAAEFKARLKAALLRDKMFKEYRFNGPELDRIEHIRREKYGNRSWTFGGTD